MWEEMANKFLTKYLTRKIDKISRWYHNLYPIWYWIYLRYLGKVGLLESSKSWTPRLVGDPILLQRLQLSAMMMVDATTGGALIRKARDEAYELLEEMTSNDY